MIRNLIREVKALTLKQWGYLLWGWVGWCIAAWGVMIDLRDESERAASQRIESDKLARAVSNSDLYFDFVYDVKELKESFLKHESLDNSDIPEGYTSHWGWIYGETHKISEQFKMINECVETGKCSKNYFTNSERSLCHKIKDDFETVKFVAYFLTSPHVEKPYGGVEENPEGKEWAKFEEMCGREPYKFNHGLEGSFWKFKKAWWDRQSIADLTY